MGRGYNSRRIVYGMESPDGQGIRDSLSRGHRVLITNVRKTHSRGWNVCHVCAALFVGRRGALTCTSKCRKAFSRKSHIFCTMHVGRP